MKLLKRGGRIVKHGGRLVKAAAAAVASCLCCGTPVCPSCGDSEVEVCMDFTIPLTVLTNQCCYLTTESIFGNRLFVKFTAFPATLTQRVCRGWYFYNGGGNPPVQPPCRFKHTLFHPDQSYTPTRSDEGYFDPADFAAEVYVDDTCTTKWRPFGHPDDYAIVAIEFEFAIGQVFPFSNVFSIKIVFGNNNPAYGFDQHTLSIVCGAGNPADWTYDPSDCCYKGTWAHTGGTGSGEYSMCDSFVEFDDGYYDYVFNPETDEWEEVYVPDVKTYCVNPIRANGAASICYVTPEEI